MIRLIKNKIHEEGYFNITKKNEHYEYDYLVLCYIYYKNESNKSNLKI